MEEDPVHLANQIKKRRRRLECFSPLLSPIHTFFFIFYVSFTAPLRSSLISSRSKQVNMQQQLSRR
jgi:hypothetical protein